MTSDMAHELRPHGVTAISLYPGLVRTEAVLAAAAGGWFDLSNSESPEFIGRLVAAFWQDPALQTVRDKLWWLLRSHPSWAFEIWTASSLAPLTVETA